MFIGLRLIIYRALFGLRNFHIQHILLCDIFYYLVDGAIFDAHFLMMTSALIGPSFLDKKGHLNKNFTFLPLFNADEKVFMIFEKLNIEGLFSGRPCKRI